MFPKEKQVCQKRSNDKLTIFLQLHLFRCKQEEEARSQTRKHLDAFTAPTGAGLALLLYSLLLSKGLREAEEDLQQERDSPLVRQDDASITFCLSNLMITGSCTPYLHNGIMDASEVGGAFGEMATGILQRNDIGFLVWNNSKDETEELSLGSRLKTPCTPVWVTCVNNNWGVLFNPNRDLMKSYSAENRYFFLTTPLSPLTKCFHFRFQLYYYSNTDNSKVLKEKRETILTIDTRGNLKVERETEEEGEEKVANLLEVAIETKWAGACIDWQGLPPYL